MHPHLLFEAAQHEGPQHSVQAPRHQQVLLLAQLHGLTAGGRVVGRQGLRGGGSKGCGGLRLTCAQEGCRSGTRTFRSKVHGKRRRKSALTYKTEEAIFPFLQ